MPIHVVRLGTARGPDEGLRIGTVRRPPRGVRRDDLARRDFYDVWLPELAPSAELLSWATREPLAGARWTRFAREYRREMRAPGPRRLITLLAALSHDRSLAVGCYCADAAHCHRALLARLLHEAGASLA